MANGHGGDRRPAQPAPASGPGALSKRTDGGPADAKQRMSVAPGQDYGVATAQMNQERVAGLGGSTAPSGQPVAKRGPAPTNIPTPQGAPAGGGPNITPFDAPTQRPGEPVTTGVDIGPGAGSSALSFQGGTGSVPTPQGAMSTMLSQLAPSDGSGVIAQLLARAQALGV